MFAGTSVLTGLPQRVSLRALETFFVAATVFLAPINYLRLDSVYVTLSDASALTALVLMLAGGRLPLRPFGEISGLWYTSFTLFAGGILLGSLVNGDAFAGLVIFAQYSFSLIVLPLILANRDYDETILMIKVFVLSMVVTMLHGIYIIQFTDIDDPRLVSGSGRLRSLVERANAAASLSAIAVSFALWLNFARALSVWLLVPVFMILGYGILLTGSNTGLYLGVVGVGLVTLLTGSASRIVNTSLLVVGVAVIVFIGRDFLIPEVVQQRVLFALQSGDLGKAGTFSDRLLLIEESINLSNSHILIGMGADQYRAVSLHGQPVHNSYLLALTEGGILSLLGILGIFASGILIWWRYRRTPDERVAGILTLATLIVFALLLNGFAHFYARFWIVPLILAYAVTIAASQRQQVEKRSPMGPNPLRHNKRFLWRV